MKVSVVLPIYNVERYLEEALDSVQRQTLKDIEIICVNDGSTDNSLSIIKRYAEKDSRFVVIDVPNGGYGKAMNLGIDRAQGEYVGIVEPDDYVALTMYEDLYEVAKSNDLDFVKADYYDFTTNENGDRNLRYFYLDYEKKFYGKLLNPSKTPQLTKNTKNTWSGIYKRDFLNKYNIRHNETPGASYQDTGFYWQIFVLATRAMFVNKPYYRYRCDNPNSSVKSREKVFCLNEEYAYLGKILDEKADKECWKRYKIYLNFIKFGDYDFTITRILEIYRKEFIERISTEFKTAYENNEIDLSLYCPYDKDRLLFLINDPIGYYYEYFKYNNQANLEHEVNNLRRENASIKNSRTYKVGNFVLYIPKKIKRLLRR